MKIDEFMSMEPHRHFLKIILDPRKTSIVSEIALYRGALYRGSSVVDLLSVLIGLLVDDVIWQLPHANMAKDFKF